MNKRLILSLVLLFLILFTPYYLYLLALVLAVVFVPFFWEVVILGFLIDVLYGPYSHIGLSFKFPVGITALILVVLLLPIRERLRFYNV